MLGIGIRHRDDTAGLSPMLGPRTLSIGLLLLVAARIALSLVSREVGDVGYASVIGAHRILHGQSLYFADIAGAAVFLASADADYVVAQTLNVDGGNWMS